MSLKNQCQLITYPDSLGKNIQELHFVMKRYFNKALGGVHILPFYPSSADRGFAPLTYNQVDPEFGDWYDVEKIGEDFDLMVDFMLNHISAQSEYFKDFMANRDDSKYEDMFIRLKKLWPDGEPNAEDLAKVYTRKPRPPYLEIQFPDGSKEKVWCTFDYEQIDIDVNSPVARDVIRGFLIFLARRKSKMVRIDAFAYVTKKLGTNCFFVEPDVWEVLEFAQRHVQAFGGDILPEIHEHYTMQLKLAEKGYWVYDFALPMLVLHGLYSGESKNLQNWLRICPRKQVTTLDTHDGIGVVDVRDLISDQEIEDTKNALFTKGANLKKRYNTPEYNNLDIYQINCTFYSALGDNDDAYILARAIQFFTPGIPQVYYVGLLAGKNDIELLERTKVGRDINRHYYTLDEIEEDCKRPVVKRLLKLMEFRNTYKAFDGDITVHDSKENELIVSWKNGDHETKLTADLKTHAFSVEFFDVQLENWARLEEI